MRFKNLIDDLADYAINLKNPFLMCTSGDVSKKLLLSGEGSVRLMTYVSANEVIGKRYVFRDNEPYNFEKFSEDFDVVWIDGMPAVEVDVRNSSLNSEEAVYFHELLSDGGKPGKVFLRHGNHTEPMLCLKPENIDYNEMKDAIKEMLHGPGY